MKTADEDKMLTCSSRAKRPKVERTVNSNDVRRKR